MDSEGIEVVAELVRDAITSPTNQNNPTENNTRVKMFGNTPVFGHGENAALRTGLVLPGDADSHGTNIIK